MTSFSSPPTEWQCLLLVVVASLLSGAVGLEREVAEKPAGFRTHMLIGGAAALLTLIGKILVAQYSASPFNELVRTDPIRIIEAIVVGISFIGAGTILKVEEKHRIRYLTTAASILFSAGIGITVALQLFYLALGSTALVLAVNWLLGRVEKRMVS